MSWAWEQDLVAALPRFPKIKPQRDVAGRHYLTKAEINALYFATHQMKRPRRIGHIGSLRYALRTDRRRFVIRAQTRRHTSQHDDDLHHLLNLRRRGFGVLWNEL
jgi:hypothetical protein